MEIKLVLMVIKRSLMVDEAVLDQELDGSVSYIDWAPWVPGMPPELPPEMAADWRLNGLAAVVFAFLTPGLSPARTGPPPPSDSRSRAGSA